ncbi:hypothetical protein [Tautonia marina]|nr:hypothetical protein [Tautonia marina]
MSLDGPEDRDGPGRKTLEIEWQAWANANAVLDATLWWWLDTASLTS